MSYSILSLGQGTRKQAMTGLKDAAVREERREQANDNLEAAAKTRTMSSMGSGAMIGASVGGPVGAAVGAAGGYIVGELF